ncbi:succinyl-diaminopimelate desuccinylase [Shewanella sp. OPT22]|nr:succinyl-diaminopimelate desuccinylase [Shewanella sp. OPT22]
MPVKTPLSTVLESPESEHSLHTAIEYSRLLIKKRSITPSDDGCQCWIADKLKAIGFQIEHYQSNGVTNLIASRGKRSANKTFAFAGHTDVVPTNQLELWQVDPFSASIIDDILIGRGAVDMKTALAAMIAAMEDVISQGHQPKMQWQVLLTSDEEGEAEFGTKTIVERLTERDLLPDYCLVGEPTSDIQTGDVIKVGRRGAISGKLEVLGKQGHVAYAGVSRNAIHLASEIIYALEHIDWDQGSEDFPGTSLQVTYINSGEFTDNIVPGKCEICFNIRYSHRYELEDIQSSIKKKIESLPITKSVVQSMQIDWERHCAPYFTNNVGEDSLISVAEAAVHQTSGIFPRLSTSGGTSDGRFLSSANTQVLELGLPNKTIHQVNESISIHEIIKLYDIYKRILLSF